jgi:hypothetical protein
VQQVFGDGGDLGGQVFVEGDDEERNQPVGGGPDRVLLGFPFGDFGFVGVGVAAEFFAAKSEVLSEKAQFGAGQTSRAVRERQAAFAARDAAGLAPPVQIAGIRLVGGAFD